MDPMFTSNDSLPTTLSLFKYQVSGKAPKLITPDNKKILKCYIHSQYLFYQYFNTNIHVGHKCYPIKRFLPEFYGKIQMANKPDIQYKNESQNQDIGIWLEHVKARYDKKNQDDRFILMENFLQGYKKPNILDIKIGGRQQKPKKITKSVAQLKLKLNGMLKTEKTTDFISKYILNQIVQYPQIATYIAYFFTQNKKLIVQYIQKIHDELKSMILALRSLRGWRFVSTSICIIYDTQVPISLDKVKLKFIDFGRANNIEVNQMYDQETCAGLQYALNLIKQILCNIQKYQDIKIVRKDKAVVPKQKIIKFESKNSNNTN